MRWSPLFGGLALPRLQKRGLTQCQPCDRPNPSQTNPFFEKGVPHPARARGTRRLAILGSSPTRNAGDTTRAIRGTRAFKAITAVKACYRGKGKTPKF